MLDPDNLLEGQVVGGCRILRKLGQGGMGAVYEARQLALDKPVALKILSRKMQERPGFQDDFLREARLAARLEHEHIVQVYDTGTDDGLPFIVMQYVPGDSLRARVRQTPLSLDDGLKYLQEAAAGLSAAHNKDIIHRDIKPDNFLLAVDGSLKVADFGLARERSNDEDFTLAEGKILASAAYMSPEHAGHMPVDAASDLYSLGVAFYRMLTGQRPFIGESHLELVLRHHLESPVAATLRRRSIPLCVSAMLDRLMHKDHEARYPDAGSLMDEVRHLRKRHLPGTSSPWRDAPLTPAMLDKDSINRLGVKRCLDHQRSLRAKNEPIPSLGELMQANGYVHLLPPRETKTVADLGFLWPAMQELPAATDVFDRHGDARERPLKYLLTAPMTESWRLTRAPIEMDWRDPVLLLRLLANPATPAEVLHLADAIEHFPFPAQPQVRLLLDRRAALTVPDVAWLVDLHNLVGRLGGALTLAVQDRTTLDFFEAHHLEQYLTIEAEGGAGNPVTTYVTQNQTGRATTASGTRLVDTVKQARAYLDANDALKARAALMTFLQATPPEAVPGEIATLRQDVATALIAKGQKAFDLGDLDNAKTWFDQAVSLAPADPEGYFHKALVLKKQHELILALRFLDEALRLKPDHLEALYHRAITRARSGDYHGAVEDLTTVVMRDPRQARAYYNRALAHEKLRQFKQARQDYELALRLDRAFRKVIVPRLTRLAEKVESVRQQAPQQETEASQDGETEAS